MILKVTVICSLLSLTNTFEVDDKWCLRDRDCKASENCEGVTQECFLTCTPIPGYGIIVSYKVSNYSPVF